MKDAADELGNTPAAVGQRIRALEDYLGTDLLLRGRSGLTATPELALALDDLRTAFDALSRVSDTLDFQRVTEIHVVADPDLSTLWLEPRLEGLPLQHVRGEGESEPRPGWAEWFEVFGHRREGRDRGNIYRNTRLAIENAKDDVGFLHCGMSLIEMELESGRLRAPFPALMSLDAPEPYRLQLRAEGMGRPQMWRFADWLMAEVAQTRDMIAAHKVGASADCGTCADLSEV